MFPNTDGERGEGEAGEEEVGRSNGGGVCEGVRGGERGGGGEGRRG